VAKHLIAILFLGPLAAAVGAGDDAAKAAKELQGEWRGVEAEAQGNKATQEAARKVRMVIKGDEITVNPEGEVRKSKFKLDPSQSPRAIDLIPQDGPDKGKTVKGIYSLEKGRLRICTPNYGGDIGQRPKEFKTQAGDGLALIVLERS
jgi:uncharacterized protein (TIGR03067 family)